jgi:hypothetical protein
MRRSVRITLWILVGLLTCVLAVAVNEVVTYVLSSEASAEDAARQDFLRECARQGLDPNEFTGPQRIKSPPKTYGFVWINASKRSQVATMVKYFPAGVESWLSLQKDGKFVPYCDRSEPSCK